MNSEVVLREPVISLPVNVVKLKSLGEIVKGEADEDTRAELCKRLGVLSVDAYAIEARVTQWKKSGVRIEGKVTGKVQQACVVTLEPVPEEINETFNVTLLPEGSPYLLRADNTEAGGEIFVDPEGEDMPEEFEGDEIDVGGYAEEFFALALDDYPRAPGVTFGGHVEDDKANNPEENPFAALASLKDQLSEDHEK